MYWATWTETWFRSSLKLADVDALDQPERFLYMMLPDGNIHFHNQYIYRRITPRRKCSFQCFEVLHGQRAKANKWQESSRGRTDGDQTHGGHRGRRVRPAGKHSAAPEREQQLHEICSLSCWDLNTENTVKYTNRDQMKTQTHPAYLCEALKACRKLQTCHIQRWHTFPPSLSRMPAIS